jgi:hypothetical protein
VTAERWIPHKPHTWPWRIGTLKSDTELRTWHGHGADPEFTYRTVPAGTKVKIVMVSQLGDVGITDNLAAENGYAARVLLEQLEPA